jgi:hypothetical protein
MTQLPTRQQVDRADPLDFPEREKQANITIEVAPDGLHIKAEYTGTLASIPAVIERLRSAGILELVSGAANPAAPAGSATPARKAAQRVEPVYQPDGTACSLCITSPCQKGATGCSAHRRPQASTRTTRAIAI